MTAEKDTKDESEKTVVAGIAAPHVTRADAPFSTQPLMPPSGAPAPQMVKVKEVATGRVFARWPVDARELVTHPNQDHVYAEEHEALTQGTASFSGNPIPVAPLNANSPIGVDPVPAETPPRAGVAGQIGAQGRIDPLTATALLEEKSKTELQELATRAGVNPNQTKKELVEALEPHVTAGTIALTAPTPLAPTPPAAR